SHGDSLAGFASQTKARRAPMQCCSLRTSRGRLLVAGTLVQSGAERRNNVSPHRMRSIRWGFGRTERLEARMRRHTRGACREDRLLEAALCRRFRASELPAAEFPHRTPEAFGGGFHCEGAPRRKTLSLRRCRLRSRNGSQTLGGSGWTRELVLNRPGFPASPRLRRTGASRAVVRLIPLVEALAGLLAQLAFPDHAAHELGGFEDFAVQLFVQVVGDVEAHVQ